MKQSFLLTALLAATVVTGQQNKHGIASHSYQLTVATLSLNPPSREHTDSASDGHDIDVTANGEWTVRAHASWITIASGSSGFGDGTVVYSVGANNGPARIGAVTVTGGGMEEIVTIYQDEGQQAESPYLVIDLSPGPNAQQYDVSYYSSGSAVPHGVIDDRYKTTHLLMRRILAGTFTMGSPESEMGRSFCKETQRQVTLKEDYYIGVFQVTQKQWERVMGNWPSCFSNAAYRDSRPVERVSYYDIRENPNNSAIRPNWPDASHGHSDSFTGKLRARTGLSMLDLPTEAQWEYAARAGMGTAFNSGKDIITTEDNDTPCPNMSEVGRYRNNHPGGYSACPSSSTASGTAKVGSYLPNAWGLYDMHGNVWEWCRDKCVQKYDHSVDPVGGGAAAGSRAMLRGGSWDFDATFSRSASRTSGALSSQHYHYGFRLSMTLP